MKLFYVCLLFLISPAVSVSVFAQTLSYLDDKEIETKVERLLLKRDVGELANELARKKAGRTVSDLLVNLSVFARAGHRKLVHETLLEIGKIHSAPENQKQILRVARRAVTNDDFTGQRIFYEFIAPDGDDRVRIFTDLWREKGDVRELEDWLKARASRSEAWWFQLADLKKSTGSINELAEEIKSKIKENPADLSLVDRYLYVVSDITYSSIGLNSVKYKQDISWLADVVAPASAYAAFAVGSLLKKDYPPLAEKLFVKSLSLPYTEQDGKQLVYRGNRFVPLLPAAKNPEKQLRFRTKQELIDIYRKTNQPQLAQPIAEELAATETSDIETTYPHYLAGAVQAASGQRVVETKVLQVADGRQDSPEYWLNRISYYAGRRETDLVRQTFSQALDKFPYVPNDLTSSFPRRRILYELRFFGSENSEKEIEGILRGEFAEARAETDANYLYELLWLINENFENLMNEFFVNADLLPQVLDARANWREDEKFVLVNVMRGENWNAEKRGNVWNRLSALAQKDVKNRAFALAEAMSSQGEYKKSVPLLEKSLKIAPKKMEGDWYFERELVERALFDAYIGSGDWKSAEKMFVGGFRFWGNELGKIAVSAAKSGNINDAVRLWKTNANLDRRNLDGLGKLAETAAKPLLREFYLQMKKRDAANVLADKALNSLQ